jgi:hypothetical protein
MRPAGDRVVVVATLGTCVRRAVSRHRATNTELIAASAASVAASHGLTAEDPLVLRRRITSSCGAPHIAKVEVAAQR